MHNNIHALKSWTIIVITLVIGFPQAMAQARYKHLPRVRIEKTITEEKPVITEKVTIPVTIENNVATEPSITPSVTDVAVATPENIVLIQEKKTTHTSIKTIEEPQKENKQAFSESVKKKSQVMEVKEVKSVKKTAVIGYLLWFFIVLLLGVAIFVLAFVFLGIIAYSLYYIFLVFGIVGLTIALLILIFGLTGVIA